MQSTVDWAAEMATNLQTASNSNLSEDVAASAGQLASAAASYLVPYRSTLIAIVVLGILASLVVILGLWLAGRKKLNASIAYIANHTALEQQIFHTFKTVFLTSVPEHY